MKFHTEQSLKNLHPALNGLLITLRKKRNFNPQTYSLAKARVLNDYMKKFGLKSCVIAVSGGIDSAVTLAIVHLASLEPGSPIEKIIPVALPVFKSKFTTNQNEATERGQELMDKFNLAKYTIDLTKPFSELKKSVDKSIGITGEGWASGQLVSYIRTPAIYYVTSLVSQINKPAIVCGTTNRDEGSYLGYFGKASDGMVDVQIISDLHKSEVRKAGEYLGVPKSILGAVPTGDMFDGRVDEEVFGAVYDFVELFLLLKSVESDSEKNSYLNFLDEKAKEQFDVLSQRLEDLHRYNGHKYLGKSPAVHLDVLESGVPGGWPNGYEKVDSEARGKEYFINHFYFKDNTWPEFWENKTNVAVKIMNLPKGDGFEISDLLSDSERKELLGQANEHGWQAVGIDGIASHYREGDKIGSFRASSFSPEFAKVLWNRISPFLQNPKVISEDTPTDWDGSYVWRPIGISPLFRFIKYTSGGLLVPHYDGPFIYPNDQRTLMSLVVYLNTENIQGGLTRFIKDPQLDKPLSQKDYSDWQRFATKEEVLFFIDPNPGSAIVFDHRILHDSSEITGAGEKVIIRSDIVFARCSLKQ